MRVAVAFVVALVSVGAIGCGSEKDDGSAEAREVIQEIESLRPGEILIKGSSAPRVYGPYDFRNGGYRVRFEHGRPEETPRRLVVAVSQKPDGTAKQPTIDSTSARGTATVTTHGRVYVAVREATAPYVIRFIPRRKAAY